MKFPRKSDDVALIRAYNLITNQKAILLVVQKYTLEASVLKLFKCEYFLQKLLPRRMETFH